MLDIIKTRFHQGYRTIPFPDDSISIPNPYRGLPLINPDSDAEAVAACEKICPQQAINKDVRTIDIGRCVFCGECERVNNGDFIRFSNNYKLGAAERKHLIMKGESLPNLAAHAKQHFKKLFGRSLALRQVSAGGCNACEADTNVLNTPAFDLSRYGIQFVASPRHADGIHVTGPVSKNMKDALLATYEAIPEPKVVIAAGSCAISGGPFHGSPEIVPLESLLEIDLFIPGCPPHPLTTLNALLDFFGCK